MATLQLSPCGAPGNAKRPSGNVPEGREGLLNQCASGLGDGLRVQFAAHGERAIRNDDAESRTSHVIGAIMLRVAPIVKPAAAECCGRIRSVSEYLTPGRARKRVFLSGPRGLCVQRGETYLAAERETDMP